MLGDVELRQVYIKSIQESEDLPPLECERVMGFPDGWTEGISDTQRIKCLGNAVMPPVIKSISEGINEI